MKVIDVHTHMLNDAYLALLKKHGGGYKLKKVVGGQTGITKDGAPFMTLMPGMFDYELRIKAMDEARVDLAIVTLTSPNVFWGSPTQSLQAAKAVNDDMAAQQKRFPDRIRFMCSLPWQHAKLAVAELKRACDELGAVGVMQLANVDGVSLTDRRFAPVWKEIDRRGLPVLIAAHGGGALPYIAGRLDICFDNMPACREKINERPSAYLRRIYYDSVVFQQESLELALKVGGEDKVLYGSDYPHNIGDMKGCLARVDALPPGQRDAVRGGNAMRIFKL